jgi:hypothetical protein
MALLPCSTAGSEALAHECKKLLKMQGEVAYSIHRLPVVTLFAYS